MPSHAPKEGVNLDGMAKMSASKMEPLHRADRIKREESGFQKGRENIAAIDFGTTYCSLAYTTQGKEDVLTLKFGGTHYRVPNAIILHKTAGTFRVKEFGYRAQQSYAKIRSNERANYIHFERIKMTLEGDEDLSRETTVQSFQGNKYYLVEVIAFTLKYLKEALEEHFSRTMTPLKATDFDWVITVPAIWKARAKRMMREAAYMAGLLSTTSNITAFSQVGQALLRPEDINPDRLVLALEPESAAIYSQKITAKEMALTKTDFVLPTKYMVIDVGGGTVDITAHHDDSGGIHVITTPVGNNWGGTRVNQLFSEFLAAIVGDEGFATYLGHRDSQKHHADLNKLLYEEFEHQKISFGENVGCNADLKDEEGIDREVSIALPSSFINFYGEDKIQVGTDPIPYVSLQDDDLYIAYRKMAEIFEPVVKGILDCAIQAIEKLRGDVEVIYLVGGFGGCKYIHGKVIEKLKQVYPNKNYKVLVPTSPELAIAQGAIMWRKDPDVIKTRRSDATYGIGMNIPFDPVKHDSFYKFTHPETGESRTRSILSVFLQLGESANTDEAFKTYVIPHRQHDVSMSITIYCTEKLGVQYLKDKNDIYNVRKIGELIIDIPNPDNSSRESRKVFVVMDFSGTEIQAKARYSITGKEVKIVCDFLTSLH